MHAPTPGAPVGHGATGATVAGVAHVSRRGIGQGARALPHGEHRGLTCAHEPFGERGPAFATSGDGMRVGPARVRGEAASTMRNPSEGKRRPPGHYRLQHDVIAG